MRGPARRGVPRVRRGPRGHWTPVQDVERLRAHLQLLEWKPKTSPVRNRQSLPKDAKFDAGDLADLADDDDDERPARRHSGGTIKLHRRTPSG